MPRGGLRALLRGGGGDRASAQTPRRRRRGPRDAGEGVLELEAPGPLPLGEVWHSSGRGGEPLRDGLPGAAGAGVRRGAGRGRARRGRRGPLGRRRRGRHRLGGGGRGRVLPAGRPGVQIPLPAVVTGKGEGRGRLPRDLPGGRRRVLARGGRADRGVRGGRLRQPTGVHRQNPILDLDGPEAAWRAVRPHGHGPRGPRVRRRGLPLPHLRRHHDGARSADAARLRGH
mmetsp:Transcript_17562/g.54010  ORF Transcript_17562/g.54010 Transcript_17562/m.54010 type:complete len:228 (+) Transcript_17562:1446-2129(+)